MSKYLRKCFGPSTRAPTFFDSDVLAFYYQNYASQLKLV